MRAILTAIDNKRIQLANDKDFLQSQLARYREESVMGVISEDYYLKKRQSIKNQLNLIIDEIACLNHCATLIVEQEKNY